MELFKKKKQAPAPRLSDTIQQLRDAQLMLEKRERHIEKQATTCREEAKQKLRQKNKTGALLEIKKAKMYDKEISQIYGKRANLDVQIMALEGAASNQAIFSTMVAGKNALKAATAAVDVDQVSDVMEDINESISMNDEVNEALSQQIGPQMDEDELNKELEEMEQEMVDQELLSVADITQATARKNITSSTTSTSTTSSVPARTTTTTITNTHHEEHKTPMRELPTVPQRVVVNASGAPASSSSSAPPRKHNIDDKEAKELKELETMMGM